MGKPLRENESRRFRSLPASTSVHEVADRCRRGVTAFVAGTSGGWTRRDLELWLGTHYCAASWASGSSGSSRTAMARAAAQLDGVFETALMRSADAVRELLEACSRRGTPSFVQHFVDEGYVVGVQDANGALGYVPFEAPSMTLVDRVASLVAADFLTRRHDYEHACVCEDCGVLRFDWAACDHASDVEVRQSGVVRADGAPVSYAAIFPPAEPSSR